MQEVTESEIRASFINCSKGDAKRVNLPPDLGSTHWEDLDFLGWADPKMKGRSYIVAPMSDSLVGLALRSATGAHRTQMCGICLTTHTGGGVSLFTAARSGALGRAGNTVGIYMCTDLQCSSYARGKKTPALGNRYREDLPVEEKIVRLTENLAAFIGRIPE